MIFTTSRRVFLRGEMLLVCLVLLLCLFASLCAQEPEVRARRVTRERRVESVKPKTKIKPKVVGAADHKEAKEKLAALGYWLTGAEDSYRQALVAFQKVQERKTTGKLSLEELASLRTAEPPAPKETQPLEEGKLRVEVDLRRQVLFVVNHENKVTRILPVSSGNGKEFKSEGYARDAVTPPGRFKVYNKIKGWKKSPLGLLYYPNYYLSGLAIHGSTFVPAYPDSHGCVRIPMFAAEEFFRMMELGTEILIYGQPETKE